MIRAVFRVIDRTITGLALMGSVAVGLWVSMMGLIWLGVNWPMGFLVIPVLLLAYLLGSAVVGQRS